jgi:hypothetical protein
MVTINNTTGLPIAGMPVPANPTTAYPVPTMGVDDQGRPVMRIAEWGLTKRELIAAMAMQGFLAGDFENTDECEVARWSIEQADALLAELAKPVAEVTP